MHDPDELLPPFNSCLPGPGKTKSLQEDAYGRLKLDSFEGRPAAEIVERDDGLIMANREPLNYFQPLRRWPTPEWPAMRWAQVGLWIMLRYRERDLAHGHIKTSPSTSTGPSPAPAARESPT